MTPDYAGPEQVGGEAISTSTDAYAPLNGTNFSWFALPNLGKGLFFLESTDASNVYLTGVTSPTSEPSVALLMTGGRLAIAGSRFRHRRR
ncbi:MAG TPA: hypothetical protein VKE70_21635 [Candidatus Solibacter sp.]|nr:hypothetical protein [Candidatus Solibacter sp.]